ncbi:MAG: FAD-binding oxidoreductase [Candidatus Lokiarchaeota archaeon]|nr:FAD-binding oxidoreductase [Candidatus Lokiarchaeota archaeon]
MLQEELSKILGKDNVSCKEIDLLAYSSDSTLISLNWMIEGKIAALPDLVVWPETTEQISAVLKVANEFKIPIVPYAEGSGVVGGAIPVFGGIILDMKKFNNVLEINDKNLTVTVEAGTNGMNLERILNTRGYTCGHIPQSIYTSSVGGWIAHRAAGQFSTKYGKIEDIVIGLEVVLPQGEIVRFKTTARASTGPQLDKLFLGNEGTLGIVTQATLKIWPYPEKRALISYAFPSIIEALESCRLILRKMVFPGVIRIYDQAETSRHFEHVENAKEKVMVVFVCEGNSNLVDLEQSIVSEICNSMSGVDCGKEPVEHWFETRFKVKESSMFPPYKIVADTIEVAVMWDKAVELYLSVVEATSKISGNVLISAHVSHFYPNGVGYYFTFGGVPPKGTSEFEFYQECWNITIKAALDAGGSFGHHHGVGINRSKWMENEWGAVGLETLRKIKMIFDPNNILNPGKVFENLWRKKGDEN